MGRLDFPSSESSSQSNETILTFLRPLASRTVDFSASQHWEDVVRDKDEHTGSRVIEESLLSCDQVRHCRVYLFGILTPVVADPLRDLLAVSILESTCRAGVNFFEGLSHFDVGVVGWKEYGS